MIDHLYGGGLVVSTLAVVGAGAFLLHKLGWMSSMLLGVGLWFLYRGVLEFMGLGLGLGDAAFVTGTLAFIIGGIFLDGAIGLAGVKVWH